MPPKKKGGKKGKAADWGSDDDLVVDPLAAAALKATAASDDDDGDDAPAAPAPAKQSKKQKNKKAPAPSAAAAAFALLAAEGDDDDDEVANDEDDDDADADDDVEQSPSPPRRASAAASFAALGLDDEGADGGDDDEDESSESEKEEETSSSSSSSLLVAAKILSIERHPDADKLSVLCLDAGTAGAGGDDNKSGRPRRVVTNAAAQLEAGDTVVLALPGAALPGGPSKAQVVSMATVRGVASEGMLCSGADLCWCSAEECEGNPAATTVPARLEGGGGAAAAPAPGSRVACGPGVAPPSGALFGAAADRVAAKERKRAKKAAAAAAAAAALAALDAPAAADAPSESLDLGATKKKKKKSTADFGAALEALEAGAGGGGEEANGAAAAAAADADTAPAADASSKKPKKKKSTADLDALMAQIEGGGGDEERKAGEERKKDKKKKKDKEEPSEAASSSSPSSSAAAAAAAAPAKAPEGTGDPEIDALLFNIENPSAAASAGGAAASKKAKKKAKKAAAAASPGGGGDVDELDAALAELGLDKPREAPAASAASSSSAPTDAADGDEGDAAGTGGGEPKELSAAQKKKLKKKAKEKAAKTGGDGGGGGASEADAAAAAASAAAAEEEAAAAAASSSSKKGGKAAKGPSAAVRRLQEELEARKRAEAAAAAAEAERIAAEEAEIAALEAEEARKAADAEARRQRQKERRAELKKQGLLLTGKAKKEAERLAAVREQFLKSSGGGAGGAAAAAGDDEGGAEKRPKKAVYEKKKKPGKGPSLSSAPSSVPSEAAEVAAEEEEEAAAAAAAAKKEEEEAKASAAEAAAAAAEDEEPKPESEEEDEDAADAWDELDLDEVVLPVKKSKIDDEEASSSSSEDEAAVAAAKKPAPAAAAAPARKKPAVLTAAEKKKAADAKAAAAKAAAAAAAAARPKKAAVAANGGAKAAAAAKAAASSDEEDDEEEEDDEDATSSDEEEEEETESESDSDDSDDDDSDDSDDSEEARERALDASKQRRAARWALAKERADPDRLRSPICCILGHVDTGKTKLLDNVRRTSVQEGEAGGITQQIGATYIPADAVVKRTAPLRREEGGTGGAAGGEGAPPPPPPSSSADGGAAGDKIDLCAPLDLRLPGLLVIDTPGHESFSNLRSRGSGLCDVAVLVVDLMHGLEPQTIESIGLLKSRKTPFVVALNKVDRLFDWKPLPDGAVRASLAAQPPHVRSQFDKQVAAATLALNEQGLNVALYWDNPDPRRYVSLVPTSAITGEGVPDLLHVLATVAQSRRLMGDRLVFVDEPQVSVLEVKVIEGLGTTVDVVLVNGRLREGDTVVACGLGGPLVATVRSLLTPHPLKELRVKGSYQHHKEVEGAQGVKICAHGLESAVAGTALLVANLPSSSSSAGHHHQQQQPPLGGFDDVEALKLEAMEDMQDIFASVDRSGEGVCAQASTLGSLEALLEFLRSDAVRIPVTGIAIGPVHKRDVMRASVMLEKGQKKFAAVLAFDVPVTREARELADELGVRVFTADIIYHLFDQFTEYMRLARREEAEAAKAHAAFPCVLKILPTCVFNKRDPIVLGVEVEEGTAAVGTPLCVPTQGGFELGRIASLELNHKAVDRAHRGDSVAMKIEATNAAEAARLYGRHFDHNDRLVSKLTRKSIDVLKEHFREDLGRDDWILVVKLKKLFGIE